MSLTPYSARVARLERAAREAEGKATQVAINRQELMITAAEDAVEKILLDGGMPSKSAYLIIKAIMDGKIPKVRSFF